MYIADLHIHSRYSRATSKDCTPEHLDLWARRKGIQLLGTGDFTHPAWRKELEEKLVPAEEGFYTLIPSLCHPDILASGERPRFVISGEISSIYKKNGKVRKVHSLILLPSLEDARALSKKLEAIGNIHSDGRPILGLDCRDLLEITLETCPDAIFIPAHIWTPHFSLFGAFSGFDTIEECFEDLTPYIHALETGLSSDPAMNWRLSALDKYQLVSNSDAHSPAKLGREANLLDTCLTFPALSEALRTGKGLAGTIEFFPEEGKYHFDGHRKCHLRLSPSQAALHQNRCPVCGKKLTIGVLHRVEELADRPEGFLLPGGKPFTSLVPLPEVIASCTASSPASKKVISEYEKLLMRLGPEFALLRDVPLEDIQKVSGPLIAEGIRRLRQGMVERLPGFDGEYGTIKLLNPYEMDYFSGQLNLFSMEELSSLESNTSSPQETPAFSQKAQNTPDVQPAAVPQPPLTLMQRLNPRQLEAVQSYDPVCAVIAGPGTGKTQTLTARILYLLQERKVRPSKITAVTFTRKAAAEMRERLALELGRSRGLNQLTVGTFHAICYQLCSRQYPEYKMADEAVLLDIAEAIISRLNLSIRPSSFLKEISLQKTGRNETESVLTSEASAAYEEELQEARLLDFDDLLLLAIKQLENGDESFPADRFQYLLVDEFQDISPLQYQLIKLWNQKGKELFVIGDPDQAIYGFRGADALCFQHLKDDFPLLKEIHLEENYRSTGEILSLAHTVISQNPGEHPCLQPAVPKGGPVRYAAAQGGLSEGIFIAKEINRLVGGIDMLDVDTGDVIERRICSFSDIAILYRTHRQAEVLEKCLKKEGIPYLVTGREDYLSQPRVIGTLSFFRFLLHPEDTFSLKLSQRHLETLKDTSLLDTLIKKYEKKSKRTKPQKLLDTWIQDLHLEEDDALGKLSNMAVFHTTMQSLLDTITFGQESDIKRSWGKEYSSGSVTLMTIHAAKGLEYPVVFLSGLTQGMFPLAFVTDKSGLQEERRLFYVGVTRAKEELILSGSASRPSAFLDNIPGELLKQETAGKEKPAEEARQLSLFDLMKD